MSILVQHRACCDWCGARCKYDGEDHPGALMAARAVGWRATSIEQVCKSCIDRRRPDKKENES